MFGAELQIGYTGGMSRPPAADRPPREARFSELTDSAGLPNEGVVGRPRRNFLLLTVYHTLLRTGWVFKTESIVIPAFLDALGGGPVARGLLPLLSRVTLSLPPLLFVRPLKILPRKKWALAACTLGMGLMFAVVAMMWRSGMKSGPVAIGVFLLCYAAFFFFNGLNQLSASTLQGKLTPVRWRGRLMLSATVCGAIAAIVAVVLLLPRWLTAESGRFDLIFGTTALLFALAGAWSLLLAEPPDAFHEPRRSTLRRFRNVAGVFVVDRRFRLLALVAFLFGTTMVCFPHYQAVGRERLGLDMTNLVYWVVVQNIGTAVFSLLIGPLADARGNKLALRWLTIGTAATPAVAIALSYAPAIGSAAYVGVFVMLGLTPVTFRIVYNFTLEICPREEQPRYLSAAALSLAAPAALSPLAGLLVRVAGYDAVFLLAAAAMFTAHLLAGRLKEPRGAVAPPPAVVEDDWRTDGMGGTP